MTTIGEAVSRLRGQLKAEVQDAFMTDRYIYPALRLLPSLLTLKIIAGELSVFYCWECRVISSYSLFNIGVSI